MDIWVIQKKIEDARKEIDSILSGNTDPSVIRRIDSIMQELKESLSRL